MEVWIVESTDDPNGTSIFHGVFATRELAKAYMQKRGSIRNKDDDTVYRGQGQDFFMECHEVEEEEG